MMKVFIRLLVKRWFGLIKNLSRDAQVLTYILKNQSKIKSVIADFQCDFSQTSKGVASHIYAFDLCAMYMAQIGENVKLLTDESKEALIEVVNIDILKYFRNMIDHNYEKVNKIYLQAYIQLVTSDKALVAVKEQYLYCMKNKKNKS